MLAFIKSFAGRTRVASLLRRLCLASLFCLTSMPLAHAGATLLLEEPYSYDGAFAGTGHVAVYLSNVCSVSPVELRPCKAGETGVVLSRYDGIDGRDWIAIPLIPYLYAVDREEAIPLFADAKLVAFLRDQYRRDHLGTLVPDRPDGSTPVGNWYEMVGSSYDRTIYAFEIETSPDQDARLIDHLNSQPNRERYNFVKRNCADFVREVVNFYYPHALHRSIVGDLGVTTPKQIAKMLAKYSQHHPELMSANFLVPQVPGAVRRSKPVHGVLESVLAAKKYMVPLVVLHPYIGGGLLVEYFGHRRFDPSRNDLVMDARLQPDAPLTRDQRRTFQSRLDEMAVSAPLLDSIKTTASSEASGEGKEKNKDAGKEMKAWERVQASGVPSLDASGEPVLTFDDGGETAVVGLSRSNILSGSSNPELAAELVEARLRQELRPATTRKTAHGDVEKDMALFRQLRVPARDHARDEAAASSNANPTPVGAPLQ
jgi:hypothetical protein